MLLCSAFAMGTLAELLLDRALTSMAWHRVIKLLPFEHSPTPLCSGASLEHHVPHSKIPTPSISHPLCTAVLLPCATHSTALSSPPPPTSCPAG